MNAYSRFIYNLLKTVNNLNVLRPMTKQVNRGTSINEILFRRKKITDNNMDESQVHFSKLKKYDSKATGSNTL